MADTWTAISGYTPQDYTDTAVFEVDSETKKIALITGQALVAGEENAQYMRFSLDRYWDGIDITDKAFYVEYALAGTYYGKTAAVNAEYNTEQVRFGWIVPKEACCISGTLLFVLRIESEDYVLKTQIAEHPVFRSVNAEDVVPEPTKEEWYREFEARVDNAISEAENAISAAQTAQVGAEIAAQNAQTAEANAEAAAAMAQIRYGSPLVAHTAEEMAEQNRVYVYTGSETGYTAGHWYYYNGTEWADGGVYNAVEVDIDTTLSTAGKAADAKATGDSVNELKSGIRDLQDGGYVADAQKIQEKIDKYLDEHPEATTTVQDGSLTDVKFTETLKLKTIKDYVTPEMFDSISNMYTYAHQNDLSVVINKDITVNGIVTILTDTRSYNNAKFTAQGFILEGDVNVEGIQFISSMVASGADEDVLLRTSGNDTIIRDCIFEFTNDNGNALAIKGSSGRIVVENCIFSKCSTNFTKSKFVTITNCTFDMQYVNTGHECIQFTAKTVGIISNNQFYNSENDFIDLFSAGSDCVIFGNTFDGCHSHNGIEMKTTIRDEGESGSSEDLGWCRRNIITNNHFRNLIAQSGGIYSFITIVTVKDSDIVDDIDYYVGEIIVSNNIFEKCATAVTSGVYFHAINCCARNVIIKGNKITINEPYSTGRTACIFVGPDGASASDTFWNKTSNIIVDSNILGGNSYGIAVRNSKNVIVSNNLEETGHAFKRFISVDGTVDGLKIINNSCNTGTYESFMLLYANAVLSNFVISQNVSNASMQIVNTIITGEISNNIFNLTNFGLLLQDATVTAILISNNVYKSTSYGILMNGCTVSNTLIVGNVGASGKILRLLNGATSILPVIIGNVINNTEDNNIRTT